MLKRTVLLSAVIAVVFMGCFCAQCEAQSKSLEELQAEIRAEVRRELGVDKRATYGQAPIKLPENIKSPERNTADIPLDGGMAKIIGVIAITVIVTVLLMKIFGGKKQKQPQPTSSRRGSEALGEKSPLEPVEGKKSSWGEDSTNKPREETAIDIYEKIERIQALKEKGVLTEEEFASKKKELLNRI